LGFNFDDDQRYQYPDQRISAARLVLSLMVVLSAIGFSKNAV